MFCGKCGRPIEEDRTICEACEAAQAAKAEQEMQPVEAEQEIPVAEVPTPVEEMPVPAVSAEPVPVAEVPTEAAPAFVVNTDTELPVKKKKKSGKKALTIILSIVAALLAAAVALTIVFWPYVSSFCKRTFMKPEDYLLSVEEKAVESDPAIDTIGNFYQLLLNRLNQPATPTETDITVDFSDELMTMLETSAGSDDVQLAWLDQVNLKLTAGTKEDASGANLAIGINGTQVLTLDAIIDMAGQNLYFGLPELNSDYFAVPLELENYLDMTDALSQANADAIKKLPSAEAVEQMLRKYKLMMVEQIEVTDKYSERLTIDKLSRKCTVIRGEITLEQWSETMLSILEDAREDETAQALLGALCDMGNASMKASMGESYSEEDAVTPDELIDDMVQGIKDSMKANEENEDDVLVIKTYVDMKDQVCGYVLSDDTDTGYSHFYLTEGDKWEEKFVVNEDTVIIGDGTEKNGVLEGTYTLEIEEESYLHVKLADIDKAALNEGKLRGTVSLVPSDSMTRDFVSEFTDSELSKLAGLTQPTLELKFEEKKLTISAKVLGKTYVTITSAVSEVKEYAPKAPESTVEATAGGLIKWYNGADLNKLYDALEAAKVPQEYVEDVKNLVAEIAEDIFNQAMEEVF